MTARRILVSVSGPAGSVLASQGVVQVLHGHEWGYLLLAAGLLASVPYFYRMRPCPWLPRRKEKSRV